MNPLNLVNVKNSVIIVGVALCIAHNSSALVSEYDFSESSKDYFGNRDKSENESLRLVQCDRTKEEFQAEQEAKLLFGEMREATAQERKAINEYINQISKPTGRSFWD